ncbi:MAG: glycine cleavage system aminomethyltransferase GcvT, partial [Candidatus Omnitrophica bacterium]|nr:glycine cleavage system aminomethyltransferase GcvT [Candidatus Omnitrophota bacterium]
TGEDGFEIYVDWQEACCWWDRLVEEGRKFGLTLCGLGSRDVLRIETGYSLYGHEIDDSTNPYEASLGWIVKMNKNFIAKENVLRFKKNILKRKKIGFIMKDRSFPRQGYKIYSDGREVGEVCSGAYSPNINKSIGMAYVRYDLAAIGTIIDVEIRNKFYKAEISELPFIKAKIKKQVSIDI